MSADPIGQAGGINLYAYVDANPVNVIDPKGLYSIFGMNWKIEKEILNRAKDYNICISPDIEKAFAKALRKKISKKQVNELLELQKKMDALPGKKNEKGSKVLSKKDYATYSGYKEQQRQIGLKVFQEVLKENPQWKDKAKEYKCKK